ncbi:hypothetical protein IJV79_00010 [bacterium]|nr:hypothetical protein [bacterium]
MTAIQPIQGQMYRPMRGGINVEIHAPKVDPHCKPCDRKPQDDGQYACPRHDIYYMPQVSIYDAHQHKVCPPCNK